MYPVLLTVSRPAFVDCRRKCPLHTHSTSMKCSYTSLHLFLPLTHTDGSDYVGGTFSVTFPAGVNVASFNVSIINDNIAELDESFTLELEIPPASAAMGVLKVSPDTATVNIMDDEG